MRRSLVHLLAIFTAAWALILLGSVVIFALIVRLQVPHPFLDDAAKVLLSAGLALLWLQLFRKLRDMYVRRYLKR